MQLIVWGKRILRGVKESKIPLLSVLGMPQNPKLNNYSLCVESLEQTHAESEIGTSVSVNLCESCLVDTILCSPHVLHSKMNFFHSRWVPLSPLNVWLWVSASARGSPSDHARH